MPAPHTSRANGQKGGRPKGRKNNNTLEKEAARQVLREMVFAELEPMTRAQLEHAKGIRHTFMRDEGGRFVQLTDPKMIEQALNSGEEGKYYWTFTKDPSMHAFAYLLDQTMDKAPQSVTVGGDPKKPFVVTWKRPK